MITQARRFLAHFFEEYPKLSILALFIASLTIALVAIAEYFKPVGKRKGRSGKKSRLPPGPLNCLLSGVYFSYVKPVMIRTIDM